MDEFESLSHAKWECKYHVVFIPKFRRKALYGQLRDHLGELLRKLATQKESRIEEGHLMPDHVHMMISIPPKYAVSQGRICQGQECDPSGPRLRGTAAQFCRATFLGARIFRLDRGERRSCDPGIHQEPGKGRSEAGATEPLALIGHHQVAQ